MYVCMYIRTYIHTYIHTYIPLLINCCCAYSSRLVEFWSSTRDSRLSTARGKLKARNLLCFRRSVFRWTRKNEKKRTYFALAIFMHLSTSSLMSLPRLPTKILDISELWESQSAKIQKEITTILNYNSQLRLIFLPHALTAVRAETWVMYLLQMLEESLKVSLFADRVE